MAVAEVVAVQKDGEGVATGQFSLGWSLLPLFRVGGAGKLGGWM